MLVSSRRWERLRDVLLANRTAVRRRLSVRATGLTLARSAVRAEDVSAAIMARVDDGQRSNGMLSPRQPHSIHIPVRPRHTPSIDFQRWAPGGSKFAPVGNCEGRTSSSICSTVYNPNHSPGPRLRLALSPCVIYHIVIIPEIPALAVSSPIRE